MSSDENCALDADGNLKDASQIAWYNDPDDAQPLPQASVMPNHEVPSSHDVEPTARRYKAGLQGKEPVTKVAGKRHQECISRER